MKYLKNLSNHNDYTAFIASAGFAEIQAEKNAVVSYCRSENHVHYNPYVPETRVVTKYNVTDTSSPTALRANYVQNVFKSMEIDGVMLNELVTEYTFSTTGIHTVKYELYDETKLGIATGGSAPIFYNSNLVECVIPNGVTYIGINVFYNCSSLTNISIPNSVTSICGSAFQACSGLTSIVIPGSVTSISDNVFRGCSNLTSIVSNAMTAATIINTTFQDVNTGGTLTVPAGSTGYDVWMGSGDYYLGKYNWTKTEL